MSLHKRQKNMFVMSLHKRQKNMFVTYLLLHLMVKCTTKNATTAIEQAANKSRYAEQRVTIHITRCASGEWARPMSACVDTAFPVSM